MKTRMILNDLYSHRLLSVSTALFMAITSMLFALSLFLFANLSNSIDSSMETARTPDFFQMHTGELQKDRLNAFAKERRDVEKMQICTLLNLPNGLISLGENTLDYERARPLGREKYLIEFLLKEGSSSSAFTTAYQEAKLPGSNPTITYSLIRMMNALSGGLMILLILILGGTLFFVSILCIRYMVFIQMEKDKGQIGILKALGISRRDIFGLFFGKYLLLSPLGGHPGRPHFGRPLGGTDEGTLWRISLPTGRISAYGTWGPDNGGNASILWRTLPKWLLQQKGESTLENEKIVRTVIQSGQQPTQAQIREIEKAASRPVMPDEDAPELTPEQYAEMAAIAKKRRSQQVKPVIARNN